MGLASEVIGSASAPPPPALIQHPLAFVIQHLNNVRK